MKKLLLLVGVGIGFVLGSKAGTGPYQAIEEKVRSLRHRPEVEDAVERAKGAANEKMTEAVDRVNAKLPSAPVESIA